MRTALFQSGRRAGGRGLNVPRSPILSPQASSSSGAHHPPSLFRSNSSSPRRHGSNAAPSRFTALHSSPSLRTLTVGFVSCIVASGAIFYSTKTGTSLEAQSKATTSSTLADHHTPSSEPRRVLVMKSGQLFAQEISADFPLEKLGYGNTLEILSPEQSTAKLRQNEESYVVGRGKGVARYDVVQVASNNPIEDDHAEGTVDVSEDISPIIDGGNSDWMFWGVFDGHSGWTTSAKLRQSLISYVARELNSVYKSAVTSSPTKTPSPEAIDEAIKRGFVNLDNDIVFRSVERTLSANSKPAAAQFLAPALSGSCGLLAFYDTRSNMLRVACTGDSRAVLGRKTPNGAWVANPLSEDQTAETPSEVRRLRREHPGERYAVHNGRVLGGLQPSRAFGDAVYKWPHDVQMRLKQNFFARSPSSQLKTPPYVTAEPVVTTTKINPAADDFLVLATDGLWEMLSNEEVVGLVGKWVENERARAQGKASINSRSWISSWFGSSSQKLPVEVSRTEQKGEQTSPVRQRQWGIEDAESRYSVEDRNAATHLVRNALGGKDNNMVCALLTLPHPFSRRYRDDLTVQVIFFGEGPSTGEVTVNDEASAPSKADTRAKL